MFLKTTGTFPSSDGHSQAACYYYEPETGKPQAVIQISHGMCEYMERYEDFAAYLCGKGFAICGNDHLGHGRTAAAPEELGYFFGWKRAGFPNWGFGKNVGTSAYAIS